MKTPDKPKLPIEPNLAALNAILARINSRIPSGDAPIVKQYHEVTRPAAAIVEAANALQKLHATRNPNETDAAHFKRVATAAGKFLHQIGIADSNVKTRWTHAKADISNRIDTTLSLKANGYASEVRAVFRSMPHKERLELLAELVESTEHGPELAALLTAPRSITGMPEDMRQNYLDVYTAKHAAAELADEDAIDDAYEHAMVALRTSEEVANTYSDETKLADLAKREAEAAAAAADFAAKVPAAGVRA